MSDLNPSTERFPHREARQIIEDLLVPSPWIYWVDFTASAVVGWGAFMLAVAQPDLSAGQAVALRHAGCGVQVRRHSRCHHYRSERCFD